MPIQIKKKKGFLSTLIIWTWPGFLKDCTNWMKLDSCYFYELVDILFYSLNNFSFVFLLTGASSTCWKRCLFCFDRENRKVSFMQMLFTNIDLHVYLTTGSQQQQHWHCFGFFKINLRLISTYTSSTCKWTLKENTVVLWFHQIIHRVTNMYLMFDFLPWNAE
jgi:hypothetical protein